MMTRRTILSLFTRKLETNSSTWKQPRRNVQVSVIGAANRVGSNVALMLKQNPKISKLKLHDFDSKVMGIAKELDQLPSGPLVFGFVGEDELQFAIMDSNLILMVSNTSRKPGVKTDELAFINAPVLQKVCRVMADRNPNAMLGLSTSPINIMLPFACSLMFEYKSFNPFRVFGMTNVDASIAKYYAAWALRANPRNLNVPVIGGHSEETIVPLYSNLKPRFYTVDPGNADKLTQLVRQADSQVLNSKGGKESPTLSIAWSISEIANSVVDALQGTEVEVHCYSANPNFGTRFFAGPTSFGPYGICRIANRFVMSGSECHLLDDAIINLNKDITMGEEISRHFCSN